MGGAPTGHDLTDELVDALRVAHAARQPLRIVGGDSKRFYGRQVAGTPLRVAGHAGVVAYEPAELVVTARAGTRLAELRDLLAAHGQHLPFEPPQFGADATLGGALAAGLAGPARVARGPLRDYVLGARLLTGDGRVLGFGGQVMKNVAGYDVSRLLAGSLGTLGVVLEASLKVLPVPVASRTLQRQLAAQPAIDLLGRASRAGLPLTASFWHDGVLHARIEGSAGALDEAGRALGGEPLDDDAATAFWNDVREQRHAGFATARDPARLWRLHVPARSPTAPYDRCGPWAFEWHGMQRWVVGLDRAAALQLARDGQGHATLFRGVRGGEDVFEPPSTPLLALHGAVKRVFDPAGILNPGRLYAGL